MQNQNEYFFASEYAQAHSSVVTLGKRLEEAMRAAKFSTQQELSDASKVPQATISRILNARAKKGPATETIARLAKACGVTFEYLIAYTDQNPTFAVLKDLPTVLQNPNEIAADTLKIAQLYLDSTESARKRIMYFAIEADKLPIKSRIYKTRKPLPAKNSR